MGIFQSVSTANPESTRAEYGSISTSQKMVKAAKIMDMPIYTTTQNSARLGATVTELSELLSDAKNVEHDKTAFSMMIPEITEAVNKQATAAPAEAGKPHKPVSAMIVGIESHICVTQTALDLLSMGHKVYILADGVSSCNQGERPIALNRLAREGCVVTTSESLLFELMGDAKSKDFKAVSGLVKETKDDTAKTVATLCKL